MFGYALTGEFAGLWRLRIGNYRAIVEYDDQTALVLYVAHRSEVYKNLKNKADRANDSDVS
ncbi:MAG: type II toxin-antitoxin system RelE/ParE family toxin [Helicobacteraceae bacterium]|nr:type II toxin-antitoxin system RelE/ParE family toxin [Helicobacteraceae bacterium]